MAHLSRILRVDVRARFYYPAEVNEPAPQTPEDAVRAMIISLYNGIDGLGDQLHQNLHVTLPSEGYF